MRRVSGFVVLLLLLSGCSSLAGATKSPLERASSPSAPAHSTSPAEPMKFNARGLLDGTAKPTFPAGSPGVISVVQIGKVSAKHPKIDSVPIALRNNTSAGVSHVDISATVRSKGKIAAVGSTQGTVPAQIPPGGVALAYVYFEHGAPRDAHAKYSFHIDSIPVDSSSYNTADLTVTESNLAHGAVVGVAVNKTGHTITGPYEVQVYCFKSGKIIRETGGYGEVDDNLRAGGSTPFSVDLYGKHCGRYAVGVTGYFA